MNNIISGPIGLVHTIFAVIAVITGAIVLLNKKGTKFHKRIGYVYAVSMLLMNITAFGIYRLFGGFGVFHVLALVSLFALFGGMYPALYRSKFDNWYIQHLELMGWSVVGLYAALVAEISVRLIPFEYLNMLYFNIAVGLSGAIICGLGWYLIDKRKKEELEKMNKNTRIN